VVAFLARWIVLDDDLYTVIGAWVMAAWQWHLWDRFPHLAITSPEKRCGKTTALEALEYIAPMPRRTSNISPAVLYRMIERYRPTLLMDEAQSLDRKGSETAIQMCELLNAGTERDAKVYRCGGKNWNEIHAFAIYSPKVFAKIGEPDGVLADRCLPVRMRRKTADDKVEQYRSRTMSAEGMEVWAKLEQWAKEQSEEVSKAYDTLEPFKLSNDRLADMLLPIQAVIHDQPKALNVLQQYAIKLDEADREEDNRDEGLMLLAACREIFANRPGAVFMPTELLIAILIERQDWPWHEINRGKPITERGVAMRLKPYGIKPGRPTTDQTHRGYWKKDFEEAWRRYLAPMPGDPSIPDDPANPVIWSYLKEEVHHAEILTYAEIVPGVCGLGADGNGRQLQLPLLRSE
jgi:putative DNA primase/helicase